MKYNKYYVSYNSIKKNILLLLPIIFIATTNLNRFFTSINPVLHILTLLILMSLIFVISNIVSKDIKLNVYPSTILFIMCLLFYLIIGTFKTNPIDNMGIALGIFQNISILLLILFTIDNVLEYEKVLSTIYYSGLILGILGILEFLNVFFIMDLVGDVVLYYGNRIGATWINPNAYGIALVFCFICSIGREKNIRTLIGKVLMILGIMVSMSRSSIVVLGIVLFYNLLFGNRIKEKNKNKFKTIITVLIVLILLFQVINIDYIKRTINKSSIDRIFTFKDKNSEDISNGRIRALWNAIEIIKENIWIGIGIKNIPNYGITTQSAHNIYFNIWAESGIVPFVFYLIFIYSLFITVKKKSSQFKHSRLVTNLFIMLIVYGFFSHTILTNPILGILSGLIILKEKLGYIS